MTFSFRPAKRESVGLWINLIGQSGSGKTFSAFRLASGIAGDKPFAVIDTENRRALHYADQFNFDHAELNPPFRPSAYAEAVIAADAAGYPVIVIDSGSHVWSGEGGVLDWQQEEFERMGSRDAVKMASWIKPKMAHKKMVNDFLRVKAHLIFCLRAEPKVEIVKENNKTVIRPASTMTGKDGIIPICDKNLPFEATASFLLHVDRPGIPDPIKLQQQHRVIFPLDKPISEESGRLLAEWASGGKAKPTTATVKDLAAKRLELVEFFEKLGVSKERILAFVEKNSIADIDADDMDVLRPLAKGIKDNTTTIDEAFPVDEERAAIEAE